VKYLAGVQLGGVDLEMKVLNGCFGCFGCFGDLFVEPRNAGAAVFSRVSVKLEGCWPKRAAGDKIGS